MYKKSIGFSIKKYIAKNNITDPTESYSNPKNDKKPIPTKVNIKKDIPKNTAKNKIKETISPKGILFFLFILIPP